MKRLCRWILIVNEDRKLVYMLGDGLRAQGMVVVLVPSMHAAFEAMAGGMKPDVIMLAHLQDGGSAERQFLRRVHEEPPWRNIPVVACALESSNLHLLRPLFRKKLRPALTLDDLAKLLDGLCPEPRGVAARERTPSFAAGAEGAAAESPAVP